MATPVPEQLIARRMGRVEIGLHAAPVYLSAWCSRKVLMIINPKPPVGFDNLTPFILQALNNTHS
jgi:hypothetical protein